MSNPIPTPPATPPPLPPDTTTAATSNSHTTTVPILSTTPTPSDLTLHLDTLLESYLHALDTYTRLRSDLSQSLSRGFLSLAHANRTTTTGRRYGEEGYDARMKAGRRVRVIEKETAGGQKKEQGMGTGEVDLERVVEKFETVSLYPRKLVKSERPASQPEPEPAPQAEKKEIGRTSDQSQPKKSSRDGKEKEETFKDPILQFGVLVPPSLKAAQNSFISAVQDVVPELVTIERRMAWLEREVEKARKMIDDTHA